MAKEDNLLSGGKPGAHVLTREEQRAGGRASAESRKKQKLFRDIIRKRFADTDDQEAVVESLINTAKRGGADGNNAFKLLRDTLGEAPQINIGVGSVGSDELKNLSDEDLRRLAEDADGD